ncbi:MAG: PIN domain-containing protein [Bacteroidetes bacterium]|jgi:hypothetical protein|nr:PIN domain-containing protein [Bacteroidota bacterium]
MQKNYRRYLFIDFENLTKVKLKKLEKVSSKIFVFVNADNEFIPLSMVQQAQKFGRNLRWVVVNKAKREDLHFHIAFLMGKLHQKVNRDVEFAILTNSKELDPLIYYINDSGRSCLRVKRKKTSEERAREKRAKVRLEETLIKDSIVEERIPEVPFEIRSNGDFLVKDELGIQVIEQTAEETIQRLIRSGNRPAEVNTLKNYILLHNEELSLYGNVDKIINKLEEDKEIEIESGAIIYHF